MSWLTRILSLFQPAAPSAAIPVPAGLPAPPQSVIVVPGGGGVALPVPLAAGTRFAACLALVLAEEGGYSDHPDDNGGATSYGITHLTLAAWRGVASVSADDVRAMSLDEARAIYRARFWNPIRADDLPPGPDYALFDFAVNSGVGRAVRALQRVVTVSADGAVGPQTLAAVRAMPAPDVVKRVCAARLAYLRGLDDWQVFGNGWAKRVARVEAAASAMAAGV